MPLAHPISSYHLHCISFDLGQVELDHARLAMLAVLLSGAVGAGAGAGAGAALINTHEGFSAVGDAVGRGTVVACGVQSERRTPINVVGVLLVYLSLP